MHTRATSLIAKLSALRWLDILSANLAIGTASVFVATVAVVSLAVDSGDSDRGVAGGNWSLRGTLAPIDQPSPVAGDALSLSLSDAFTGLS